MRFDEFEDSSRVAQVRISIDGEIDTRSFAIMTKAASFFYRLSLFSQIDDLEVRTDLRPQIAEIISTYSPRTLQQRPINVELLANFEFFTSQDIRYALISPTATIGVKQGQDLPLRIEKIRYESPGFIVFSGIASAIEAVFKAFAAVLSFGTSKLDRRIKQEQLVQIALQNYEKMHELRDKYGITAAEIDLVKAEGSIMIFLLLEESQKKRMVNAQLIEPKEQRQYEDA